MSSSFLLGLCIGIGGLVALVGLFRPFLGLLVFLAIHFIQPGELVPALEPLRIELVYGTLLIFILVLRRASIANRTPLLADRILRAALFLIGVGLLSIPFSIWRGGAAGTVIEMVKLVTLMFLMKLMVDTEDRMRSLLWCMAAIAAWLGGSSLSSFYHGQYYHLTYNVGNLNRAQGVNSIVGGPNELAGLLLALLPLLIALLQVARGILARALLISCGALSLMAIALTGSRIAVVGLLAIGIYYTLRSKRKIATLVACVVIGTWLWMWMPPEYRLRYLTVQQYAEGGKLDDSNELRLQVWAAGRQIFLEYPILGVGAGQFRVGYGLIYLAGRHAAWMQPHNLLIQIACELGIIGLGVFVYFLVQLLKGIRVVLGEKGNPTVELSYHVGVACSVMFVGVLLLSAVGHTLYRPYWYVLGGLVAANRGILLTKLKIQKEQGDPGGDPSNESAADSHDLAPFEIDRGEAPTFEDFDKARR
jgi:O-antigen ligase